MQRRFFLDQCLFHVPDLRGMQGYQVETRGLLEISKQQALSGQVYYRKGIWRAEVACVACE